MRLKALIRNFSANKHIDAIVILRNYMQERLLERVSVSKYKNNFILKGGMLISAMVGIDARVTMDMDATIKGQVLTETEIVAILNDILSLPIDDNIKFILKNIDEIREEADYPGYRMSIEAVFEKTRQMLKLDITTGDFVTPKEIVYRFPLMFENRAIDIMAYNFETILAEKFETIITRSVTNTRMRDFYDIYILTSMKIFDYDIFTAALKTTVEKRKTAKRMEALNDVIKIITESTAMSDLWQQYQKKYIYAANVTWKMVIEALKNLCGKCIYQAGVSG
jgi:predicted nucleotidyltransferase component of viral defense system